MKSITIFLTTICLAVSVVMVSAQCDALVEQALVVVGDSCESLERNTACYGYTEVRADFTETQPVSTFTRPADRVEVELLQTLRTGGYVPERDEWGVAVMSLQANLPGTLPGQGVTMLLVGGGEVYPEADTEAPPMSAFTFTSGVGIPSCAEAPSAMAVRSPGGQTVELTINGVDVEIGSTIIFTDNGVDTITALVTEGTLTLVEDGTAVTAGNALDMTAAPNSRQIASWGAPRPATNTELELGTLIDDVYEEIGIPADGETVGAATVVVEPGDNLFRIALENDTCVSALAQENNLSDAQIRALPVGLELTLTDNSTCNAGVNDVPLPAAPPPTPLPETGVAPVEEIGATAFICDGLRATSPLDGLPFGDVVFYWDGLPEATNYVVTVFRDGTAVLESRVTAPTTSLRASLANIPSGPGNYEWTVTAFGPDGATCTANSGPMLRAWDDTTDEPIVLQEAPLAPTLDPACIYTFSVTGLC